MRGSQSHVFNHDWGWNMLQAIYQQILQTCIQTFRHHASTRQCDSRDLCDIQVLVKVSGLLFKRFLRSHNFCRVQLHILKLFETNFLVHLVSFYNFFLIFSFATYSPSDRKSLWGWQRRRVVDKATRVGRSQPLLGQRGKADG